MAERLNLNRSVFDKELLFLNSNFTHHFNVFPLNKAMWGGSHFYSTLS